MSTIPWIRGEENGQYYDDHSERAWINSTTSHSIDVPRQVQGVTQGTPQFEEHTTSQLQYPGTNSSPEYTLDWPPSDSRPQESDYLQIAPENAQNAAVQVSIEEAAPDIPGLVERGLSKVNFLRATPGDQEDLDPRFQKQHPNFFRRGRVFKCLWPENAGYENDGATFIIATYNQKILAKIRWFVVVKGGEKSCTCLPIQTYGRKGVGKPNTIKSHHAIVYTGQTLPRPNQNELPAPGEYPMRNPIKVSPTHQGDKLDRMSRINFSKVYTVEHYVKAYDFGVVESEYEHELWAQFLSVWNLSSTESVSAPTTSESFARATWPTSQPLPSAQHLPVNSYGQQPQSYPQNLNPHPQQWQTSSQWPQWSLSNPGNQSGSWSEYGGSNHSWPYGQ